MRELDDTTLSDFRSAINLTNEYHDQKEDDQINWNDRTPMHQYTYIDNTNACERLNLLNTVRSCSQDKPKLELHARNCEIFFNGMKDASERIGMKINPGKNQLLWISTPGQSIISAKV